MGAAHHDQGGHWAMSNVCQEKEVWGVECMLHFAISILELSLNNTPLTLVFAWIYVTASTLIVLLLSTL